MDKPSQRYVSPAPSTRNAVRRTEVGLAKEQLERDRRLLIAGPAGVGKTVLGAQVAREIYPEEAIFWYTFAEGTTDAYSVFWDLARFLEGRGEAEPRRWFEGRFRQASAVVELQAHSVDSHTASPVSSRVEAPAVAELQAYFVEVLRGQKVVLCFDDVQRVLEAAEGERAALFNLFKAVGGPNLPSRLLLMSRERLPDDVGVPVFELRGMVLEAFRELTLRRIEGFPFDTVIEEKQLGERLWELLEGNPQYLLLFANMVRGIQPLTAESVGEVLEDLPSGEIGSYLNREVYKGLGDEARRVLTTVSLFRRPPKVELVEEVMGRGGWVMEPGVVIEKIKDRFLLEERGGRIVLHEMWGAFLRGQVGGEEAAERHRVIGEVWEGAEKEEEGEWVEVAYHYSEGGELRQALEILGKRYACLRDEEYVGQVLEVLKRLGETRWREEEGRVRTWLLRGRAYHYLGRYEEARDEHKRALVKAKELGDERLLVAVLEELGRDYLLLGQYEEALEAFQEAERRAAERGMGGEVMGRIYYGLAELYAELKDFSRLQKYARRSIEAIEGLEEKEKVAVRTLIKAYTLLAGGYSDNAQMALKASEKAVKVAEEYGLEESVEVGIAYANAAYARMFAGELVKAEESLRKAVEVAKRTTDLGREVVYRLNLGNVLFQMGKMGGAEEQFVEAEEVARRIKSSHLFEVDYHLAMLYLGQGRWEESEERLRRAQKHIKLASERMRWKLMEGYLYRSRAMLAEAVEDGEAEIMWETARGYLEEAGEIGSEKGKGKIPEYLEAERKIVLAEVLVGLGKVEEARQLAEEALKAAEREEDRVLVAQARQVLVVVYAMAGNWADADGAYRKARRYYVEQDDKYELARTEYYRGRRLELEGKVEEARQAWTRSKVWFEELTAEGKENQYVRLVEATMERLGRECSQVKGGRKWRCLLMHLRRVLERVRRVLERDGGSAGRGA